MFLDYQLPMILSKQLHQTVPVILVGLAPMLTHAQHGGIREYAALAPATNARLLQPLLDEPLLVTGASTIPALPTTGRWLGRLRAIAGPRCRNG
jgi:hypothetical protein